MDCLEYRYFCLSQLNDYYPDDAELMSIQVIEISEPRFPNQFQISGKLFERPIENAKIVKKSGPDGTDEWRFTISPDDETLLIVIDNLDGKTHLICNDCFNIQEAMVNFAFKSRDHYLEYHGECNIEHTTIKEGYFFDLFVKEMQLFFHLKHEGLELF